MSNLTPLFNECVEIVTKELGSSIKIVHSKQDIPPYFIQDTFIKECSQLYLNLVNLASFISQIKPYYLQVNDEFSKTRTNSSHLSLEEKNRIDEEFKIKIQQVFEKLKFLQSYQRKQTEATEPKQKKEFISSLFGIGDMSPEQLYFVTIATHRTSVLKFLHETATTVSKSFELIQRKRYNREKQLSLLNFQNIDDDLNEDGDPFQNTYQIDLIEDESTTSGQDFFQLSQEQLQELKEENQELLDRKTNQLKQVEKLHHSMVDIINLQSEISTHLQTQSEQINLLIENQDQVDQDLRSGNQTLRKATHRNKRGSNFIVTICVVLGFTILILDYIVW